ncbi:MAG: hypothetical protein ACLRFR_02230 [Clostridia bacterium]
MKQTLKYIYDKLVELAKIAEAKYSITLALASGVIVLGSSFIGSRQILVQILASATIVLALISIIYGFVALMARSINIRQKKSPKNKTNLMHFKTIIDFDEEGYLEALKSKYGFPANYKFDEFDRDLARSVIAQARVDNIKFAYFNLSLIFLIASVFSAVAMVIILGGL